MNKPCILHITEAVQGGVARHLEWIAQALPGHGFRLHFVLSLAREPWYRDQVCRWREQGIGVDLLPMARKVSPVQDWEALRKVVQLFRERQPSLVHSHSSKAGVLARRAACLLGLRAVHTPHIFAFEWARPGLKRLLYTMIERAAAKWCDRIILLSEAQKKIALAARIGSADKFRVVPNGIDADSYPSPSAEERRIARERFGLPEDAPVIGMAARLDPQKGVGNFLRAAATVQASRPDVRFLIAGTGALAKTYEKRVVDLGLEKAVTFCGNVTHILPFYHALDAFVLASLWEGLPYVLLEAQSTGLPVVASRTHGAEAVIESGKTGLLVPLADEAGLAQSMCSVINDTARARELGQAGREHVRKTFTLPEWASGLAECYREVLSAS